MANNLKEFPPSSNQANVLSEESMTLFTLGDQRFAIQWIVTELDRKPAKVIPFERKRLGKKQQRSTQI
jgi:hypothetical protein